MNYISCLLALSLMATRAFAQKEANVWHFGTAYSLDFSSGEPIEQSGSEINAYEGSSSYCDAAGNLLFYSNGGGFETMGLGGSIWNAANESIYEMNGVQGGGFSAMQTSLALEAPGQPGFYYLFTMDDNEFYVDASEATMAEQPEGRGLSYFTIDMSLNGGLGEVVEADQRVHTPSGEGLCAIRHANGEDYWLIINQDSTGVGVYSVTAGGVAWSSTYAIDEGTFYLIKASPDGTRFFVTRRAFPFESYLFSFDPATGTITEAQSLGELGGVFYFEFSPDSRYLYVAPGPLNREVFRFDLESADIAGSLTSLFDLSDLEDLSYIAQMQLGPDGNIYMLFVMEPQDLSGVNTLNRITCPNTEEPGLDLNVFTITQPEGIGNFIGLPNFPAWIFESEDANYVSLGPDTLCYQGEPIVLDALNPGATYLWSTGSTAQSIAVDAPGTYSVTVNGACGTGDDQVVVVACNQNGVNNGVGAEVSVSIQPNPVTDILRLSVQPQWVGAQYRVTDLSGRVVLAGRVDAAQSEISLAALSPGGYLISLAGSPPQSVQFIKE
jgi:hypothetical protein